MRAVFTDSESAPLRESARGASILDVDAQKAIAGLDMTRACRDERKVRAPQSTMPGNAR